ncbi:hypothetical protein AAMO2058_000339100 [Amorphochlora amoebiformis]
MVLRLNALPVPRDEQEILAPMTSLLKRIVNAEDFQGRVMSQEVIDSHMCKLMSSFLFTTFHPQQLVKYRRYMEMYIKTKLVKHFHTDRMNIHVASTVEEARIFAIRGSMYRLYPSLAEEGASTCRRPPVFYYTAGAPISTCVEFTASQIFMPKESFVDIPIRQVQKSTEETKENAKSRLLSCYEMKIEADKASGRLPCCVIATLGARAGSLGYQCDDIANLRRICDKHSVSLFVEGTCMLLCGVSDSGVWFRDAFSKADAVVLQPLTWLRTGSSPSCGVVIANSRIWWSMGGERSQDLIATTNIGMLALNARVESHLRLCNILRDGLKKEAKWLNSEEGPGPRQPHISIFRIRPAVGLDVSLSNLNENSLQEVIYDDLKEYGFKDHFSLVKLDGFNGLLFHPRQSMTLSNDSKNGKRKTVDEEIKKAVVRMRLTVTNLILALSTREKLISLVADLPNLQYIQHTQIKGFVGIGGVRYVPPYEVPTNVIDSINRTLAHILSKKDSRLYRLGDFTPEKATIGDEAEEDMKFSRGKEDDSNGSSLCIVLRSGITNLEAVLEDIVSTGSSMELPQDVMDALAAAIARGIQEAEEKILLHNTNSYHPITLVRKAPLIGSIFGYIFPPSETQDPAIGHTFNIARTSTPTVSTAESKSHTSSRAESKSQLPVVTRSENGKQPEQVATITTAEDNEKVPTSS